MVKRIWILIIITAVFLFFCETLGHAASIDGSLDKKTIYDNGKFYLSIGDYESALTCFERISGYADSASWKYWCQGMLEIEAADSLEEEGYLDQARAHIETATRFFTLLAGTAFEQSARYLQYCKARVFELKSLRQAALELYVNLFDILDSDVRYLRLISGISLPTQAPYFTLQPVLTGFPAHALRKTEVYQGPGREYARQTLININADMPLAVIASDGDFYLIETTEASEKIRCWIPKLRVLRDSQEELPQSPQKGKACCLIKQAETLYGPDETYKKTGGFIKAGARVTAFLEEGEYTMIEYLPADKTEFVRVWVLTESLSENVNMR